MNDVFVTEKWHRNNLGSGMKYLKLGYFLMAYIGVISKERLLTRDRSMENLLKDNSINNIVKEQGKHTAES